MALTEREKYLKIYSNPLTSYGKRNHGYFAYDLIKELNPKTLLDVGCGKGQFVEWAKTQGIDAVGIDFASGYGIEGDVLDMPFEDNSFDVLTAFDVLEHIKEENLDKALSEMKRVSPIWVLSIGYGPSGINLPDGHLVLHEISTRDKEWWTPVLSKYGHLDYWGSTRRGNSYIIVR